MNCSKDFVEDTTNLVKLTEGLLFLVSDLACIASGSNSKLRPGEGAEMVMLANLATVKVRNHIEKHKASE